MLHLRPSLSSLSSLADRCGTHYRPVSQVVPRLDTTPGERSQTLSQTRVANCGSPRIAARQRAPAVSGFDERFVGYGKNKIEWIQHLRFLGARSASCVREATRAHHSPHARRLRLLRAAARLCHPLPPPALRLAPKLAAIPRQEGRALSQLHPRAPVSLAPPFLPLALASLAPAAAGATHPSAHACARMPTSTAWSESRPRCARAMSAQRRRARLCLGPAWPDSRGRSTGR